MTKSLADLAPQVSNLETDLCNGVVLIELLKSIYGKKVGSPNYNKTPQIKVQYLDNASIVCKMLIQAGHPDHFLKPERKEANCF